MDERDVLSGNFAVSSRLPVAGKQSDKATAIQHFSLTILLLPILSGSLRYRGSLLFCAFLFLIIVLFRVDHAITEESRRKITLTGTFEQCLAFTGQGRNGRCHQRNHIRVVCRQSNGDWHCSFSQKYGSML